jgi:hypothetical protein
MREGLQSANVSEGASLRTLCRHTVFIQETCV